MLTTVIAVFAAIALLVPGFLVAEIAIARGARSSRSDLELALRALVFAMVIHLAFIWWTAWLADRVGAAAQWHDHRVEGRDGPPPLWAAALGAGQARDAYDFAFQRVNAEGAWVIVELVGHTPQEPRLTGGLYGRGSAVGQTPAAHDIYLERLCVVIPNEQGLPKIVFETDPPRGLYVPASQIARVEVLPAGAS